jgi:hypothetical protein
MLVALDAALMQQLKGLTAGGLVVVVMPMVCAMFWFAVIGIVAVTRKMLRKWFHKEHVCPTTWYD